VRAIGQRSDVVDGKMNIPLVQQRVDSYH